MPAPAAILDLVARFGQQLDTYKAGAYNETQVRRDFLDPFFKALGWDMDNEQGYAEAYRDVIHEDVLRIGREVRAPDYSFRIGGTRKFFLEAKRPSVDVRADVGPAFQLRRYAFTAKLPLSLLSDFEEFAVYDGRYKPHKDDPAAKARIFYCTFRDYAEKWDWICERFSRDAVLKGGFDQFAESTKAKKGTTTFDQAFLETIEGWRLELARNLALRNPNLTQRELNFAVQRIIDRIIFLRICEDRGIEDYGRLRALVNGERVYPRLCEVFEAADARYNSGLFHFKPEKDRHEAPDELTRTLDLDDKLLRDLLRSLYYPDCPYAFEVVSADILGQVYEQFLGKVIRLTEGHRAVVDDKPEVKKAGGVYYTPTYIVDYIVRQTVGKLVEDCLGGSRGNGTPVRAGADQAPPPAACDARTATAILGRVDKLRILDPACGSGSFLIGAYQYLLDWHLDFYTRLLGDAEGRTRGNETRTTAPGQTGRLLASPPTNATRGHWLLRGKNPPIVQTSGGGWKLTIATRKQILLNHIFGVDIDAQAVEVTKLSLLLKVLEGETEQSLQTVFRFSQERALPDLGDNIKCGNSLIGPDFYEQQLMALLDEEARFRLNVFDWPAEFPQVFRRRRGDESPASSEERDRDSLRRLLPGEGDDGALQETAAASPLDFGLPGVPVHGSYSYKQSKGAKAPPPAPPPEPAWEGGFDAVIGNPPYVRMEELKQVKEYLRRYQAFEARADLYTYFIERETNLLREGGGLGMIVSNKWLKARYGGPLRHFIAENLRIHELVDFGELRVFTNASTFPCIMLASRNRSRSSGQSISFHYVPVRELKPTELRQQVESDGYVVREGPKHREESWRLAQETIVTKLLAYPKGFVPLQTWLGDALIGWGIKTGLNEAFVLTEDEARMWLKSTPRLAEVVKPLLIGDEVRRYSTVSPEQYLIYAGRGFDLSRFPRIDAHLESFRALLSNRATVGVHPWYELQQPQPKYAEMFEKEKLVWPEMAKEPRFTIVRPGLYLNNKCFFTDCNSRYLLGILNSRLAWELLKLMCSCLGDVNKGGRLELRQQYLTRFPMPEITDKSRHDRMVKLVEQMLALHRQAAAARTPQEQTSLARQIAATDTQIDRLVYDLYGLTEAEIKIVEGAATQPSTSPQETT